MKDYGKGKSHDAGKAYQGKGASKMSQPVGYHIAKAGSQAKYLGGSLYQKPKPGRAY